MIEIIKSHNIRDILSREHRQYLVGDLQLPQELEYILDDKIEMGITRFEDYAYEKPHFHPIVTEYQIQLSGETKYIDLDENKEYLVSAGDVFVIRPNTKYLQKSIKGTVILFFKNPGGNDKTLVDMTEKMEKWCSEWDMVW